MVKKKPEFFEWGKTINACKINLKKQEEKKNQNLKEKKVNLILGLNNLYSIKMLDSLELENDAWSGFNNFYFFILLEIINRFITKFHQTYERILKKN